MPSQKKKSLINCWNYDVFDTIELINSWVYWYWRLKFIELSFIYCYLYIWCLHSKPAWGGVGIYQVQTKHTVPPGRGPRLDHGTLWTAVVSYAPHPGPAPSVDSERQRPTVPTRISPCDMHQGQAPDLCLPRVLTFGASEGVCASVGTDVLCDWRSSFGVPPSGY